MRIRVVTILIAALGLSACGGYERDIGLRDMYSGSNGPDEFGILPGKALQAPDNFAALPVPTPGGANLTDQNPRGDAIAVLGGKPERLVPNGIPTSDGALVRHASRRGVDPAIRESLATEDEAFRRRKSRFTRIRIAKTDRYNDVYKRQTLNSRNEWNRFRRAGVRTPTAPPPS